MTVVVDASIVVPAALTASWVGRLVAQERVAPSLIWSEVASALRQLRFRNELDDHLVDGAISWLETAEIGIHSSRELMHEAVALASQLGWAKTYDAEYVVLARRLNAPLATADARLRRAVQGILTVIEPAAL